MLCLDLLVWILIVWIKVVHEEPLIWTHHRNLPPPYSLSSPLLCLLVLLLFPTEYLMSLNYEALNCNDGKIRQLKQKGSGFKSRLPRGAGDYLKWHTVWLSNPPLPSSLTEQHGLLHLPLQINTKHRWGLHYCLFQKQDRSHEISREMSDNSTVLHPAYRTAAYLFGKCN